jgi:hypothetical protein
MRYIYLFSIILLINCKSRDENKISINGHWHCVEPCGLIKTLDILDSLTITNKLDLLGPGKLEHQRFDENGNQILPTNYFEDTYSDSIIVKNDTLEIYDSTDRTIFNTYKYVRSLGQCELQDRYINSVINIELSDSPTAENYEELFNKADLFIGTSIKPNYQRPLVPIDSILIQADDVFINLEDLQFYYKEKQSELLPSDKLNLVLHVDRLVNDLFIQRLIKQVPGTIPVYKAVTQMGQLRVIKLNRD